jgi:hypothetical protein
MRKRKFLIGATLGVVGALLVSGTAMAGSPISHKITTTFSPKKQDKKKYGGISIHEITDTTYDNYNGSPSSRSAAFTFTRDLKVTPGNLPACSAGTLNAATSAAAIQSACGPSVVGNGFAIVNGGTGAFTSPNPVVAVHGGGRTMYLWVRVAGALTLVLNGQWGAHNLTVTGLPNTPGTDLNIFDVTINKKQTGKSTFYAAARCSKKKKWTSSETVTFHNGQQLSATSTQKCKQK